MSSSTRKDGDMKKFLFDTHDFDEQEAVDDGLKFTEEDVIRAREAGHAAGMTEGQAEAARAAREAQEEKIGQLLEKAGGILEKLAADESRRETEKCIDTARMALHVVQKMMPALAEKNALPEIERIIAAAIEARRDEPRLAVTVPTALLENLRARIDALAAERGFAGSLILIADDGLGPSDCRIEWADGGSERLLDRLTHHIASEFAKTVGGLESLLPPDAPATDTSNETPTEEPNP